MKVKLLGKGSRYDACKRILELNKFKLVDSEEDIIVLANYNQILSKSEYSKPKYGAINLHAGKLPEYRGSSVLNWQIINGEKTIGLSIIQVDDGIDTGDILWESTFPISEYDDIQSIRGNVDKRFSEELPVILDRIEDGTIEAKKQSFINAQQWLHRIPADSEVKFQDMTALQIHNLIRACENPYRAFAYTQDKETVIILESRLIDKVYKGVAGKVLQLNDSQYIVIAKDKGILIKAHIREGMKTRIIHCDRLL